jgi:hypothetical protein
MRFFLSIPCENASQKYANGFDVATWPLLTPYISEKVIATSNPLTLVKRNPMKKIPSKSHEK